MVCFYVLYISGKEKKFFNVAEYRVEIGKDYKRIVFYLCEAMEFDAYEELEQMKTMRETWKLIMKTTI